MGILFLRRFSALRGLAVLIGLSIFVVSGLLPLVSRAQSSSPILLITSASATNKFGPYLAEILRAEGLPAFDTSDISTVTASSLAGVKLVVLAEMPLTSAQAGTLVTFVSGGGRLVAMRPDPQLAPALGVTAASGATTDGYLAIDTASAPGSGFTSTTLPFKGDADHYSLASAATAVAQLYSDAASATVYPAVVRYGNTATWAYDLARSVAYTRQGNPAYAGQERDGVAPVRTIDVFYNAIDKDRLRLPVADIQMRLLSRLIGDMLSSDYPLPRLWYFPSANRTLLVLTGDSHGVPASAFQQEIGSVEARGGHISIYPARYSPDPSAAEVAAYRASGNEFGMHPYSGVDGVSLSQGFSIAQNQFSSLGWGAPSRGTRIHTLEWQGWADGAKVEADNNIGIDTTFYTWGPAVIYGGNVANQAHGHINGSGLPMRFVDENGTVIPVYQQSTAIVDEQLVWGSYSQTLSPSAALAVSQQLIDDSQNGGYSAVTTQFHVDYFTFGEVRPWAEGTMDYASQLGIPMWTAEHWLRYNEARRDTSISGMSWSAASSQLSFSVSVPSGAEAQSLALPGAYGGASLSSVTLDGATVSTSQQTITGRATRFVNVASGSHSVVATYNGAASAPTDTQTTTVTRTPSSTPTGTLPPSLTPTPSGTPLPPNTFLHTTAADFLGTCAAQTNTIVSQQADGEVRLAGTLGDEYEGGALDSQWISGGWNGSSNTISVSGGQLALSGASGAFVRSANATQVNSLEATAQFAATPWQHIGWGDLGFMQGKYLLFSTFNGSTNLYARSANSDTEQRTDLGPIPSGLHTYRIERDPQGTSDVVRYYIDGELVATHTTSPLPNLYIYQSHNSGSTALPLQVERIWAYSPYQPSGSYIGCAFDASSIVSWSTLSWAANVPGGDALSVRTRTSFDGATWSAWSSPLASSGASISSPAGRYLQYQLSLSGDGSTSPVVASVDASYQQINGTLTPTVTATATRLLALRPARLRPRAPAPVLRPARPRPPAPVPVLRPARPRPLIHLLLCQQIRSCKAAWQISTRRAQPSTPRSWRSAASNSLAHSPIGSQGQH